MLRMTKLMVTSAATIMASSIIIFTRVAFRIVEICPYFGFPILNFRAIAKITSDLYFIQSSLLAN